jgi:tetratricopeptide (TPR) repeat protein
MYVRDEKNFKKGHAAFVKQEYETAIKYFQKSIKKKPKIPDSYGFIGLCYYALGQVREGIEWMDKAIERDPGRRSFKEYKAKKEKALREQIEGPDPAIDKPLAPELHKILLEFSYTICESTYSIGESKWHKEFFFLMKNLFDAIELFYYDQMNIKQVHKYYFWLQLRRNQVDQIKEIPYNEQLDPILERVYAVLQKSKSTGQFLFIEEVPSIIQEKREVDRHRKNLLWRLGAFIIITLRGEITKKNPLIQFLIQIIHLLEDAIYSQKDPSEITNRAKRVVRKWEEMQQYDASYYGADQYSYDDIFKDLEYTMDGVQKFIIGT